MKRYRSFVADSDRWRGFEFRPDDIVICTPPKCGTTWTQMLCALLIFGPDLPRPLAEISPWLDMQTADVGDVFARLAAQEHRRFIKTHTPLDGLPSDPRVTYVCVGRDPRDVALSWDHHLANMDFVAFFTARANAAGIDDLAEFDMPTPPAEDPRQRFWDWADNETGAMDSITLAGVLQHLQTFWDRRDDPNVALFHFGDLQADLPGQLARLAGVLAIDADDARIAELAAAASFENMKARADDLAPNVDHRLWLDNSSFFHRGASGQWRELLDDDDLKRYDVRVAELVAPDLAAWAHHGWLGSDRPT